MRSASLIGTVIATAVAVAIVWMNPARAAADHYVGAVRVGSYHGLLVAASYYALRTGGAPERWVAAIVLAMAAADPLLHFLHRLAGAQTDLSHQLNDLLGFSALFVVAMYANRFWPILVTALVGQPIFAHLADATDEAVLPSAYYALQVGWSYLALVVLIVGTARHQRREAASGVDRAWSSTLR